MPGMVTNLTRFGAFFDIGVKQDGLVHVSEIANRYISDPNEVLKLNDKVQVKVMEIDLQRKRTALSIKQAQAPKNEGAPGRAARPGSNNSTPKTKPANNDSSGNSMESALSALKLKFKS